MSWKQVGPDKGIWTEYVNEETGESSIKVHKLKTVWKSCGNKSHDFELTGNRELTCKKCKFVLTFTPGKDNKLLKKLNLL